MKKLLFIGLLLSGLSAAKAQNLQTVRKTVMFKYTPDWCGICGGWDLFDFAIGRENTPNFRAYCLQTHTAASIQDKIMEQLPE